MNVRSASAEDRDAIRRVARDTWHDTYDELEADTIDDTVDEWYADESFTSALEEPGTAVLVAEDDGEGGGGGEGGGEVVGFAHGVVHDDEGDVLRMYVHPDHQREGVGTALHERLRTALEDFNMNRMRAIDLASNEGGRAFYEGLGFEQSGEGDVEMGGETHREVVYTLEL